MGGPYPGGTRSPHQLLVRSWLAAHLKRTLTRPIRHRQPAIAFGDPVRVSPATRGSRPFPIQIVGEGGDQNTTFPRSDRGVFRTFPSARAPPTIPVPRGLDPATLALFRIFDPRHHTNGPQEASRAPPPPTATTAFEIAPDGSAAPPRGVRTQPGRSGRSQRSSRYPFLPTTLYRNPKSRKISTTGVLRTEI